MTFTAHYEASLLFSSSDEEFSRHQIKLRDGLLDRIGQVQYLHTERRLRFPGEQGNRLLRVV